MSVSAARFRRAVASTLFAISLILGLTMRAQAEPRPMPQTAFLPNFNPLCDSNLVHCLDIDDFAAHASVRLMVLPRTELRDTAAILPYSFSLGLFGRFVGGVSSSYAFWREGDAQFQQNGPLRLSVTALLWPLFPFHQPPEQRSDGGEHFAPPRHLRIGLSYEHELRVWQFDGANSLGFLADLAMLRLGAVKVFGPVEVTVSLGALYDWQGKFATAEAAAQGGLYLPFFKALKAYVEILGRGVPAYVRQAPTVPMADGASVIPRQGILGFGLSFRPHARVDLGASVQMAIGGLAPAAVNVHFLVLSAGRTYQGRAATPLAQLAADAAAEVAVRVRDFLANLPIDPKLKHDCIMYDDDHSPMGRFGTLSKNGQHCEWKGQSLPVGVEFFRDRRKTLMCRDQKLTDCFMARYVGADGSYWEPLPRPFLDGNCVLHDHDGHEMERLGQKTPDGEHCAWGEHRLPIGKGFYRDATARNVCLDPRLSRCFVERRAAGTHWSPLGRIAKHLDAGASRSAQQIKDSADAAPHAAVQAVEDVATGKITVDTITGQAKAAAEEALRRCGKLQCIEDAVNGVVKTTEDWLNKPTDQKVDDALEKLGSAAVSAPLSLTAGALTGPAGRIAGELAEEVINAAKAGKKTRQLVKAAQHIPDAAVPKGGTYKLIDPNSGKVMRTGRTNDLDRRRKEHQRHPETKPYGFQED